MRWLAVDFDRQPTCTGLNAANSGIQLGKLSLSFGRFRIRSCSCGEWLQVPKLADHDMRMILRKVLATHTGQRVV